MNGESSLTRRDRRTLFIGVMTIGGLATLSRAVPSVQAWTEERRAEAAAAADQLALSRRAAGLLSSLRDSLRNRRSRVAAVDSLLIRGSSVSMATAGLASILEDLADDASVKVNALQMRADTSARQGLTRVAVRMTGTADVAALAAFLRGVEGGDRLLAVRDLTISQPDPAAPDSKPEVLRIDVLVEGLGFVRPDGVR